MALLAAGSVLVAGGVLEDSMSAIRNIKVVRAFYWQGKPLSVGTTKELPTAFALEMCASGKAEIISIPLTKTAEPDSQAQATRNRGGKDAS